jgi:hypothetical protein
MSAAVDADFADQLSKLTESVEHHVEEENDI